MRYYKRSIPLLFRLPMVECLKKSVAGYALKTDCYVVETNVHFPTDYNLLLDCTRKSLDMVDKVLKCYPELTGWIKRKDWQKRIKNISRRIGQISGKGGPNKDVRLKDKKINGLKVGF